MEKGKSKPHMAGVNLSLVKYKEIIIL